LFFAPAKIKDKEIFFNPFFFVPPHPQRETNKSNAKHSPLYAKHFTSITLCDKSIISSAKKKEKEIQALVKRT
jgi:hypothetical protein